MSKIYDTEPPAPPSGFELRPYQQEGLDAMLAAAGQGEKPLAVWPTGSGKSLLCAGLARAYPSAIILANRAELISQNAGKLPGATMACATVGTPDFSRKCVVASRDTARSRLQHLPAFDACIIDEAHMVSDKENAGYQRILRHLFELNPDMHLFGMTATPWRLASGALASGDTFTCVAHELPIEALVENGSLAPVIAYAPRQAQINTRGLKVAATGDYKTADVQRRVEGTSEDVARHVAQALQEGRRAALVFCVSVQHVEDMTACLRRAGLRAACTRNRRTRSGGRRC